MTNNKELQTSSIEKKIITSECLQGKYNDTHYSDKLFYWVVKPIISVQISQEKLLNATVML